MADETRIKLIGAGLILATVVVAFIVFSQRFSADKVNKDLNIQPVVQASPTATPSSSPAIQGAQASSSPAVVAQGTLPKTGFPVSLFVTFAASAAIAGYGLRKYPH
jgi:hypothetical protein